MTVYAGVARNIDNRRLWSLWSGVVYIPELRTHVPWEGFGERAFLHVYTRNRPLQRILAQPETVRLSVGGRRRRYTPDYEVEVPPKPSVVVEAKGERSLADPDVQDKLAAAELHYAAEGKRFLVVNSSQLAYSDELRNTEMVRRYAEIAVSPQDEAFLTAAVRLQPGLTLRELADTALAEGISRRFIYALMYRDVLRFDWTRLLRESTPLTLDGAVNATRAF